MSRKNSALTRVPRRDLLTVPFDRDDFFAVFEAYNTAAWPAQLVLYAMAVACVALVAKGGAGSRRASLSILALLWLWMGSIYHFGFFTAINPMAWVFGAACIVQALVFAVAAARDDRGASTPGWTRVLGGMLVAYALVVYPLLGQLGDHAYPRSPTFGLPCPTTIFTFGVLLLQPTAPPRWIAIIPGAWGIVGTSAAFSFGVYEDLGLGLATAVAFAGLYARPRRWRNDSITAASVGPSRSVSS